MVAAESSVSSRWHTLAGRVLSGHALTRDECRAVLECPDVEVVDLLAATFRVRRQHFGLKVHFYLLKNAKSGLCPEDCHYCSQSVISEAEIDKYVISNERVLMEGARRAKDLNSRTYCIVASGRGPSDREVDHVCGVVKKIKDELGLHICVCLGFLKPEQAKRLADAGVDRVNHNLNTSRGFYETICTTHTYQDRVDTLDVVRDAGMELCSGLIVGMGEQQSDIIDVVMDLRGMKVASIPVNFLHAVDGTPLQRKHDLDPRYCLKVLCLLRLAHPTVEIRIAGGRELNLRSMQAMGLYAANSLFVSDYLTTKGQSPELDFEMIKDLGFEIIVDDHSHSPAGEEHDHHHAGANCDSAPGAHSCGGGGCGSKAATVAEAGATVAVSLGSPCGG